MEDHLRLWPRLLAILLVPVAFLAMLPIIILLAAAYYVAVAVRLVVGHVSNVPDSRAR